MQTRPFFNSIGEAINFGWDVLRTNTVFYVGISIGAGVVYVLVGGGMQKITMSPAILSIVSILFMIILKMGFTKIFLNAVGNYKEPEIADFFSCIPLLLNYLIGSILFLILVAVPMLLVVPGAIMGNSFFIAAGSIVGMFFSAIWALKYCFYGYIIIDREYGPVEALRESAEMTEGIKWDLLGFLFVIGVIQMLGTSALLIGAAVTFPVTSVAFAYVYRNLNVPQEYIPVEPISGPGDGPGAVPDDQEPKKPVGPILNARKQ